MTISSRTMRLALKTCVIAFLLTLPFVGQAQTIAQKPKRIYITLDVSGSMDGNKYIMANYAAQTIAVFSNPEDIVNVYYLGKRHGIGSSNGYKQLQIPFNRHPGQNTYHEISDLGTFLRDYHPDPKYQDWLFIIGDGDWNYAKALADYEATTKKLSDLFASGQLQVCYLQTGNTLSMDYPFTEFLLLQSSPLIEIRRSDTTATSVLSNCTFFANKILGFSNTQVPLQQQGPACVTFRSEFPLDHCVLVYQSDKTNANEVAIASVECGQRRVNYHVKGNPSTKPLVQPGNQVLNGVVWELSCPQTIPANEAVKVCFNQDVDVKSLTLYPYVDVTLRMRPFSMVQDTLVRAGAELFKICDKDDHVLVKISATDKHNHKFPPPLMQRMNVKIIAGGKEVTAIYSAEDTTFQAALELSGDTLSYFSKVESPGYFSRVSPPQTVVKSDQVCPPERVPLITLPVQQFNAVTFDALMTGGSLEGVVNDTLFQALAAAGVFDDKTMHVSNSWMLEDAGLSVDGLSITITQKPRNGLCECAFPDTLRYEVTLRSTNGILHDGKLYEGIVIPITVPVDKRGWWERCWMYVVIVLSLIAFVFYLIGLLKKKRFHKGARLKNSYVVEGSPKEVEKSGKPMREPGFGPWLSRWFNPFVDEKTTLKFVRPKTPSMTFTASNSKNKVLLSEASFDSKKMTIPGYTPPPKDINQKTSIGKPIDIPNGTAIEIKATQGGETTRLGHVKYLVEEKKKKNGYLFFVITLLLGSIAAIGIVLFTLMKSI